MRLALVVGADLFFEKEKGTAGYLLVGGWFILREKHADWWLISQANRVSLCLKGPQERYSFRAMLCCLLHPY
jgi:hypothetical protein